MSILPETKLLTAEELFWMPDDGRRLELLKGELRKMPPAGGRHGCRAMRLGIRLGGYVLDNQLGEVFAAETGFTIAREPDTVRAPDVAFVSQNRLPDPIPDKYLELAPDLVVEVVSPNDTRREVRDKVNEWLDAGVRIVWVVDTKKKTVIEHPAEGQVRVFKESDILNGGGVVPGFSLPVREIFA